MLLICNSGTLLTSNIVGCGRQTGRPAGVEGKTIGYVPTWRVGSFWRVRAFARRSACACFDAGGTGFADEWRCRCTRASPSHVGGASPLSPNTPSSNRRAIRHDEGLFILVLRPAARRAHFVRCGDPDGGLFHRAADLRLCDRHHHAARGLDLLLPAAGLAISRNHASAGRRQRHISRRRFPGRGRHGHNSAGATDQRRARHDLHVVGELERWIVDDYHHLRGGLSAEHAAVDVQNRVSQAASSCPRS